MQVVRNPGRGSSRSAMGLRASYHLWSSSMLIGDRDTADQAIAHGIDRLLKEALGASETVIGEVFGAYLRYGTACQKWLVELDSGELALRDEWDAASCFSLQLSRLWSDTEDRLIHAALQSVAREGTTVH